jgi:hypothetical protein
MGNEQSCTLCAADGSVGPHVLFRHGAPKSTPGTHPHAELLFSEAGQKQHSSLAPGQAGGQPRREVAVRDKLQLLPDIRAGDGVGRHAGTGGGAQGERARERERETVLQSCARPHRALPDLPAMYASVCPNATVNRAGAAAAPLHVYAFSQRCSIPASAGAPTAQVPREDTWVRRETDAAREASRAATPFCSVSSSSSSSSSLSEEEDLQC